MFMNKKLTLLIFVITLSSIVVNGQKKGIAPVWPGVEYSYVKLYLYNLDNQLYGKYQPVKNGKLDETIIEPGLEVPTQFVTELLTILNGDTRVLNEGLSKCYEPHHAFVFYDDKGKIVASSDVCFLCQGVRFYPAKKYFKEVKYSASGTKAAEKQLDQIKAIVQKTEIPVYEKSADYLRYAEKLATKDTLGVQNDSMFLNLIKPFTNVKALLKSIPEGKTIIVDSTKRYVAGGDKVMFYFLTGENISIECSSYNGGQLWITMINSKKKYSNVFTKIDIGDRKYEIFEKIKSKLTSYPYEKSIMVTAETELIVYGFDENHYINSIYYKSRH